MFAPSRARRLPFLRAAACFCCPRLGFDEVVSTGRMAGSFLPATAGCAGLRVGAFSVSAGCSPRAADLGSSAGPRCRSRNALHVRGNTISPEAVIPIGVQLPGGISSLSDDGTELCPIAPVVCAKTVPDAVNIERTTRPFAAPQRRPTANILRGLIERDNMNTPLLGKGRKLNLLLPL
jgi:hypothetical protein